MWNGIGIKEDLSKRWAVAPGDVLDSIDRLQQDTSTSTSVVAFVVGAAGAVWAASGAMNAVIKAVNRAYGRGETRPFWKTRALGVFLALPDANAANTQGSVRVLQAVAIDVPRLLPVIREELIEHRQGGVFMTPNGLHD